jgi:Holliday junction DNA helicase RuvA
MAMVSIFFMTLRFFVSAQRYEKKSYLCAKSQFFMYEFISGRVADLTPAYAVIDAGGVGYYINISLQTFSEIEKLPEARLYVHFTVREDAQILYGFATTTERELFRRLVSVSGVGGNTARMVLSTYSPAELANIISSENALLLKNVRGLGLKTAEKIIVELRDKVTGVVSAPTVAGKAATVTDGAYGESMAALSMLGFSRSASDKVVRAVMHESPGASVEEVIRQSLKRL